MTTHVTLEDGRAAPGLDELGIRKSCQHSVRSPTPLEQAALDRFGPCCFQEVDTSANHVVPNVAVESIAPAPFAKNVTMSTRLDFELCILVEIAEYFGTERD